ncbi:MAG: hypothetical protein FJ109_15415 [Deltaproteobacteria bacterium]|nr:hypothetical protein [Deltaproteobacteria bacterium]
MRWTLALLLLPVVALTGPASDLAREPDPRAGKQPPATAPQTPPDEVPEDMKEMLLMMDLLEQYGDVLDAEDVPGDGPTKPGADSPGDLPSNPGEEPPAQGSATPNQDGSHTEPAKPGEVVR